MWRHYADAPKLLMVSRTGRLSVNIYTKKMMCEESLLCED